MDTGVYFSCHLYTLIHICVTAPDTHSVENVPGLFDW